MEENPEEKQIHVPSGSAGDRGAGVLLSGVGVSLPRRVPRSSVHSGPRGVAGRRSTPVAMAPPGLSRSPFRRGFLLVFL